MTFVLEGKYSNQSFHCRAFLSQDAQGDQGDQGLPAESQEERRKKCQDQEEC